MKKMNSYMTIGNYSFTNLVHSVKVDSSWQHLTQTAHIKMPRFKQLVMPTNSDGSVNPYFIEVGMPVMIQLGYDNEMVTEFQGYITEIFPRSPLEFRCEDQMWVLKQTLVNKSWTSISLIDVLKYLLPNVNAIQAPAITLTNFRIDRVNTTIALEKIKDEYGLAIYFRNNILYAGLAYGEMGLPSVVYHFQANVPRVEKGVDLIYKTRKEVNIRLRAISNLANGHKIEVIVGDDNKTGDDTGAEITRNFYNILTKEELIKLAVPMVNLLKYDGYRGTLTAFGQPYATHTMIATIIDNIYPERQGDYFIDRVEVNYGSDGFRRILHMGRLVSSVLYTENDAIVNES